LRLDIGKIDGDEFIGLFQIEIIQYFPNLQLISRFLLFLQDELIDGELLINIALRCHLIGVKIVVKLV
jgi:hypothetical protein